MAPRIIVAGLGPAGLNQVTVETWQAIQQHQNIILRTGIHPAALELLDKNIKFKTCDHFYTEGESFPKIYGNITEYLIMEAQQLEDKLGLLYCVPGHPLVAEDTVQQLLLKAPLLGVDVQILSAMSFLDPVFTALKLDPTQGGFAVLDALLLPNRLPKECDCLFTQVYNRWVASDLKLSLLDQYPSDHPVILVYHAGEIGQEKLLERKLSEMDHESYFDHLTSVYVPKMTENQMKEQAPGRYPLDPLIEVFEELLGPTGCPWDREQTHGSLKQYLLEETHEVMEAIDLGDMTLLQEELGDVLMQIVFHGALAHERGDFDYNDIIQGITDKLVRRHPHVFATSQVAGPREVEVIWDQIKAEEKEKKGHGKNMYRLPYEGLPALLMADEYQKLIKKMGKEKITESVALDLVKKNWQQIEKGIEKQQFTEAMLGETLYALVVLARAHHLSAETGLIAVIQGKCKNLPDNMIK